MPHRRAVGNASGPLSPRRPAEGEGERGIGRDACGCRCGRRYTRAMSMRRPNEEIARLGDEIYERDIRALVKDAHDGEYVAIDVDSDCWAVAGELLDAADRLRERQPDAINVWLLRVGYRAVASLGGGAPPRVE